MLGRYLEMPHVEGKLVHAMGMVVPMCHKNGEFIPATANSYDTVASVVVVKSESGFENSYHLGNNMVYLKNHGMDIGSVYYLSQETGGELVKKPSTGIVQKVLTVLDKDRVYVELGMAIEITESPVYKYREITAEESASLTQGSAEWSYGNGATGYMGIVVDAGWEVEAMYFHADSFSSTASVQVDLMDYGTTASIAAANTIESITVSGSTDGGGTTNNAYKYVEYSNPVSIPVTGNSTVVGFITRTKTGTVSDARVGAILRKQVGTFVNSVQVE